MLLPEDAPGGILLAALLSGGTTMSAQGRGFLPQGLVSALRRDCLSWGRQDVCREWGCSARCGHERLHGLGVRRLQGREDLSRIGRCGAFIVWALHHQAAR